MPGAEAAHAVWALDAYRYDRVRFVTFFRLLPFFPRWGLGLDLGSVLWLRGLHGWSPVLPCVSLGMVSRAEHPAPRFSEAWVFIMLCSSPLYRYLSRGGGGATSLFFICGLVSAGPSGFSQKV